MLLRMRSEFAACSRSEFAAGTRDFTAPSLCRGQLHTYRPHPEEVACACMRPSRRMAASVVVQLVGRALPPELLRHDLLAALAVLGVGDCDVAAHRGAQP